MGSYCILIFLNAQGWEKLKRITEIQIQMAEYMLEIEMMMTVPFLYLLFIMNRVTNIFLTLILVINSGNKMKSKSKAVKHFSVTKTSALKQKNISHRAFKSPNVLDKTDEDLKWLEKLVTGFQWYKIKQDSLFDNTENMKNLKNEIQLTKQNNSKIRIATGVMKKNSSCPKQQLKAQIVKDDEYKQGLKNNSKILNTEKNINNKSSVKQGKEAKEEQIKHKDNKINNYKLSNNKFSKIQKNCVSNQNHQSSIKDKLLMPQSTKNKIQSYSNKSGHKKYESGKKNSEKNCFENIQLCQIKQIKEEIKDCKNNRNIVSTIPEKHNKSYLKATRRNLMDFENNRFNLRKEDETKIGRIIKNAKSVETKNSQSFQANRKKSPNKNTAQKNPPQAIQINGPFTQPQIQSYQIEEKIKTENNNRYTFEEELSFKKYNYYIEKKNKNKDVKQTESNETQKKQRRLNSSVQNRTNKKNNQHVQKDQIKQTRKRCITAVQSSKQKPLDHEGNQIFLRQKQSDKKQQSRNIKISELINTKSIQKRSIESTTKEKKLTKQQKKQLPTLLQSLPSHQMKFAVSTKNSIMMTEQNSYVIEKLYNQPHLQPAQLTNCEKPQNQYQINNQPDWDVIKIFSKLDRHKTGIINLNNCSIESLSRELRYIFGPILEQIIYGKIQMSLQKFIQKVEALLNKVSCFQTKQKSSIYLETKNLATQTERSPNIINPVNKISNQPVILFKKLSKSIESIDNNDKQQDKVFKYGNNKKQENGDTRNMRFPTFQNDSQEDQPVKYINPQRKQLNQLKQKIEKKSLQLDLENRLSKITDFKSPTNLLDQIKPIKNTEASTILNQSYQIEKLDQLNKRLQSYLIGQSMSAMDVPFNSHSQF